jgi:hypothetical protein
MHATAFQISPLLVTEARRYVADVYKNLIDATGALCIYTSVLSDMNALFVRASAMGLNYQVLVCLVISCVPIAR